MMNEYRTDISKIHASEELIRKTLEKIGKEEKKSKNKAAKIVRLGTPVLAAAAAIVVFVNIGVMNRSHLTINQIDQVEVRTETSGLFMPFGAAGSGEMTEEEFNDHIGLDCENLFEEAEFDKSVITGEKGIFYYEMEAVQVSVKLSKTEDLIPESMKNLESSDLAGHELCLAKDDRNYYAAGNENGINYCVTVQGTNDKGFEKLIKDFLKNF